MQSTGLVLAAGGIAAANEAIFAPMAHPGNPAASITNTFNWRIIPATAVLAFALGGLETVSPGFAKGLAGLTLLAVLITPMGHAGSPLENLSKFMGY